jgi:hypothetical protein
VTVLGRRLDVDYVAEAVQISVGGTSKRPGAKTGEGHGEVLVSRWELIMPPTISDEIIDLAKVNLFR